VSLRLFLDQCVPRSVSESLQDAGHTVDLLRSHLPINAKDPDVIKCAQRLEAVLVTLNGDFSDIINYPPSNFGGIVALQVRNHPESLPAIIIRLLTYLGEHTEREHWSGKLFLVEPHRIRIKE
jgi:predicted nuclease of predicted toxin-antitoxin system